MTFSLRDFNVVVFFCLGLIFALTTPGMRMFLNRMKIHSKGINNEGHMDPNYGNLKTVSDYDQKTMRKK